MRSSNRARRADIITHARLSLSLLYDYYVIFFFFFSLFSTFVILYRTKVSRLFIYYLRPSRRAISLAQLFLLLSTMSGGWTLAWVGFGRLCFRQIRANLVMFVYTIGGLG